MSFRDPNYSQRAARAADRQERMRQAAAARGLVKEAFDVDYNDSGKQPSAIRRFLSRLRRGDRERQ